MANFKRGYKKDRLSTSDWKESAYERKQTRKTPLDLVEKPVPAKFPSNYCKKLKAKHNFILKRQTSVSWIFKESNMFEYQCSGCGKKKIKFA